MRSVSRFVLVQGRCTALLEILAQERLHLASLICRRLFAAQFFLVTPPINTQTFHMLFQYWVVFEAQNYWGNLVVCQKHIEQRAILCKSHQQYIS
jgi:hypothetical protein